MQAQKSCVVLALMLLASAIGASANPIVIPEPLRARTRDDLVTTLRGPASPESYQALLQLGLLGPEYTWLLEELAHRDDINEILVHIIFGGLSANGDSASVSVLLDVASDTTRTEHVRVEAVKAIGQSRFHAAIPSLIQMAQQTPSNRLRSQIERAILCIKEPGRFRELITFEDGYVRYGFLLDDVEFVEWGSGSEAIRFDRTDAKAICDSLQAGEPFEAYTLGTFRPGRDIVFGFIDGRTLEISSAMGNLFWHGSVYIRSSPLATLLKRLASERTGEPPN